MAAVCDSDCVDGAHAERAVKGTFVRVAVAESLDYSDRMWMWENAYDDDEHGAAVAAGAGAAAAAGDDGEDGVVGAAVEAVADADADVDASHGRRNHWRRRCRRAHAAVVFVGRGVIDGD